MRHEVLKRGRRGARRLLTPQRVDQAIGGDHASDIEEQECEDRALLLSAQGKRFAVGGGLERTEDSELEPPLFSPLAQRKL